MSHHFEASRTTVRQRTSQRPCGCPAAVPLVDRDEATEAVELPQALRLSLGTIAGVAREGLLAMCTTVGLAVMGEMMTAQMTAKVGESGWGQGGGGA
jgi:hypothetical protein